MNKMSFWADMDGRARRLGILDTKLAQAAAIFIALALAKLLPQVRTLSIWWFIGLAALCAIKPIHTFCFYRSKSVPRA
jgi:hypothetical protein